MPYPPIPSYQAPADQYSYWSLEPVRREMKEKFLKNGLFLMDRDNHMYWEPNRFKIFSNQFQLMYNKGRLLLFREYNENQPKGWLLVSLDTDLTFLGYRGMVGRMLNADEFRSIVGSIASWRKIPTNADELAASSHQ